MKNEYFDVAEGLGFATLACGLVAINSPAGLVPLVAFGGVTLIALIIGVCHRG